MSAMNAQHGSTRLVADSHNDAIVSLIRRGGQSIAGPDAPARNEPRSAIEVLSGPIDSGSDPIQVDVPKLKAGGVNVAYFAVDVTLAWGNHLLYALDALGWFLAEVEANSEDITVAMTFSEIEAAVSDGKIAAVLTIENSEVLQRSLHVLPLLYQLGVRSITLTWSYRAEAADGAFEPESGGGLTKFGRDLVRRMNDLGMLVDISHINDRGFWDVVDVASDPLLGSHNCCRELCDHPRNLTDEQIRAIAEGGGVIGVTYVPHFVDEHEPSLDRLLRHIEHMADVGGVGCVGLGSDFDGGGDLLTDASQVPRIADGLVERGWADSDIAKVMGSNHMRVFQQVCG